MTNSNEDLMDQSGRIEIRIDPFVGPWYFDGEDIIFVIIDPIEEDQLEILS